MKPMIVRALAFLCLACSGTAFGQAHTLTYEEKFRAIDSILLLNNDSYKMARVPVRDFVSLTKYAVIFPAPQQGGFLTNGVVSTAHSAEPFDSNTTISSFPAQVQVIDGLTYVVSGDFVGEHTFTVVGSVTVLVSIDIGNTIVTITNVINVKDPGTGDPFLTDVVIGETANAVASAQWGRYVDPVSAINAADAWIDYIRITPL